MVTPRFASRLACAEERPGTVSQLIGISLSGLLGKTKEGRKALREAAAKVRTPTIPEGLVASCAAASFLLVIGICVRIWGELSFHTAGRTSGIPSGGLATAITFPAIAWLAWFRLYALDVHRGSELISLASPTRSALLQARGMWPSVLCSLVVIVPLLREMFVVGHERLLWLLAILIVLGTASISFVLVTQAATTVAGLGRPRFWYRTAGSALALFVALAMLSTLAGNYQEPRAAMSAILFGLLLATTPPLFLIPEVGLREGAPRPSS